MNDEYVTVVIKKDDAWVLRRVLEVQLARLTEFYKITPARVDKTANEERQAILANLLNQLPIV